MSEMKKIKNLKEFSTSADRFEGANLLCPGCAHSIIVREVLNATNDDLILSASTGCLEVCTSVYPYTSWDASWIHIGFEKMVQLQLQVLKLCIMHLNVKVA